MRDIPSFQHESLPFIIDALISAKNALADSRPYDANIASCREHQKALDLVETALGLATQALPKKASSSLKELL